MSDSAVIVKAVAEVRAVAADGESPGEFEVILSTPTMDRDGDEVKSDEWELPLPEHITFDHDHTMSVIGTIGSGVPSLDADGRLIVRGTYSSRPLAQEVRGLVNEKHIRTTSVAYLEKRKTVDGRRVIRRELLNGAFVAIPSNTEAEVVTSKSAAAAVDEVTAEGEARAIVKAIAGSYEERQGAVYEAVADLYADDWRTWAYLVGTTADEVVWRVHSDDDDLDGEWRATYTLDEATFDVTLGDPQKVRVVQVVTELPESSKSLSPETSPDVAAKAATSGDDPGDADAAALAEQQEIARAKARATAVALQFLC